MAIGLAIGTISIDFHNVAKAQTKFMLGPALKLYTPIISKQDAQEKVSAK